MQPTNSTYTCLSYTLENGVCTITFNRPDVYNAFNNELSFEMQDALKKATKDENVRVVVITGAGKAFCSGQDLKAASGVPNRDLSESLEKRYNPIIRLMRNMPKPIIARVNGVAAGAGCSIALACDIIVAAESAKFIEIFINIGLVLDSGSSYFLPRLVGSARAFEMSTMGSRVTATQAFEWGMINKVVADEQLDKAVEDYTNYYLAAPKKAIGLMKKMLNKSFNSSLDEMLDYEMYCQKIAGYSHDYKEGVDAFVAKRKPEFKGN